MLKEEGKKKQKMELSDEKRNFCKCRVDENLLKSNIRHD